MKIKTIHRNEYINLINYLIALRKQFSISQTDMAKALNLKQADISKIEIKERRLDVVETFLWIKRCNPNNNEIILEAYNIFIESTNNEEI